MKQLNQVQEFHEAFEMPVLQPGEIPTPERIALRVKLIREEMAELKEAHESGDMEQIVKETCDLVYVCLGTILEFGLQDDPNLSIVEKGFSTGLFHRTTCDISEEVEDYCSDPRNKDIDFILLEIEDYLHTVQIYPKVFEQCFDEVHRSNMSKLSPHGKPIYREDGKVLKGPNYTPADLSFLKVAA